MPIRPDVEERFLAAVRAVPGLRESPLWLVACSGGADSTALAHLAARAAPALGAAVALGHLDHALRADSADDADFVERLAARLGVPCVRDRRPAVPDRGESPEAAARRVRHAFLAEVARSIGARAVLTAHHLDDQAETVLQRAATGTGLRGLAGVRGSRPLPGAPGVLLARPLLDLRRDELRGWLAARGEGWREDPTNGAGNPRARLRNVVLPALASALGRDPAPALARLAASASAAAAAEGDELPVRFLARGTDDVRLLPGFERLPRGLRLRALGLALEHLRGAPATRREAERLLRAHAGAPTGPVRGVRLRRGPEGWALLRGAAPPAPPPAVAWDLRPLDGAALLERLRAAPGAVELLDADRLVGSLSVRCRVDGDRFRPLGAESAVRLGHFLQRRGVPAEERGAVPLLCDEVGVAWVAGHAIAHRARLHERTCRVLVARLVADDRLRASAT